MRIIVVVLALVAVAMAAPMLKLGPEAEVIPDSYIVVFKQGTEQSQIDAHLNSVVRLYASEDDFSVTHRYGKVLPGFTARMSKAAAQHHLRSPLVSYVEPNQVVRAYAGSVETHMSPVTPVSNVATCKNEGNPSWGLARVTNLDYVSGQDFYSNSANLGASVTAYIIDTGIYTENVDFGGRAKFGWKAESSWSDTDANGHGTHVASTIGGTKYGFAKQATLVAVKVLGDNGSGSTAGVIGGLDWAAAQAEGGDGKAVANLSLGGGFSRAMNAAADAAAELLIVVVAAGNDNRNAANYSPASAANVITVGSTAEPSRTGAANPRSSFSNYGSSVNIFAPGSSITAAWVGSPTATATISGTSMASPHVAGVAALLLQHNPIADTQKFFSASIQPLATTGTVSDPGSGSANVFLQSACRDH